MLWLFIQHQTSTTATFWILKLDTLALDTKTLNPGIPGEPDL